MSVAEAIAAGRLPERLWLYATFDCNLSCRYCLSGSSPTARPRRLGHARCVELARQARALGFRALGVTGGEPFLVPELPRTLAEMAEELPVVVLTNGLLLRGALLDALDPLLDLPVELQLSLDAADAEVNDRNRGAGGHRSTLDTIRALRARGHVVRVASTSSSLDEPGRERLRALLQELGIPEDKHLVRPIVQRGRARFDRDALPVRYLDLSPELTITAEGAYWGPFGPTVSQGRVDTDLLLTRTTLPLSVPARALLDLVQGQPPGEDARLGIR